MKPEWKDAPEWANWLAMDQDGSWQWWDKQPDWASWYWDGGWDFKRKSFNKGIVHKTEDREFSINSLEARP